MQSIRFLWVFVFALFCNDLQAQLSITGYRYVIRIPMTNKADSSSLNLLINKLLDTIHVYQINDELIVRKSKQIILPLHDIVGSMRQPRDAQSRQFLGAMNESQPVYFIYEKGRRIGLEIRQGRQRDIYNRLPVKSYGREMPMPEDAAEFLNDAAGERVQTKILSDGITMEIYLSKPRTSQPSPDTTKLYYSAAYNHLPVSFSENHDGAYDSKLFKIESIFSHAAGRKFKTLAPARMVVMQLLPMASINEEELHWLYDVYEQRMRTLGRGRK